MTLLETIKLYSPDDYDLPHPEFRPHQAETIEWLLDQTGITILQAPTGSGKSSYVRAIASKQRTIVLTKTKSLQSANYDGIYGMDTLYGKSNYDCIHPDGKGNSAALCLFTDLGMHKCDYANKCPYWQQKILVSSSNKISLNYAYWLTAQRGWLKDNMPEVLFLDECHLLPEIVIDWAGCTVNNKERLRWHLPDFPVISQSRTGSTGGLNLFNSSQNVKQPANNNSDVDQSLVWLEGCLDILRKEIKRLSNQVKRDPQDKQIKGLFHSCERLGMKLRGCLESLEANPTDWYIKSGESALERKDDSGVSGFLCKPLTAKHHFNRLFVKPEIKHIVLMSATPGKVEELAKELGIGQYNLRVVPSVFKPQDKPVYAMKNAPRMGYNSKKEDYEKQADLIAELLLSYPQHWTGVIHVNSKYKAAQLQKNLGIRGLKERVCIVPEVGTDQQIDWWSKHKRRVKGAIVISWSWSEGVDLFDDNFCISADIPFGYLGEEYASARFQHNMKLYSWQAGVNLEQRCGRIRRGDVSHYGVMAEKVVVIADRNWTRVKSYLSDEFIESIVEV